MIVEGLPMGQEISGCEVAQTNNNTFLIKPGSPITTVMKEKLHQ